LARGALRRKQSVGSNGHRFKFDEKMRPDAALLCMNFDDAAKAHFDWKVKLRKYLENPDKSLDARTIEMDNRCELGKWIHGESSRYAKDPDFQELRKEHANFHRVAASVVQRADAGEKVAEEVALGASSAFGQASKQVVQLLMKMKLKSGAVTSRT